MEKFDDKVVILTREKSYFGGLVLKEAVQQGLKINLVISQEWRFKQKYKRFKAYSNKYGFTNILSSKFFEIIDVIIQRIRGKSGCQKIEDIAKNHNIPFVTVPKLNGNKTVEILNSLSPDVLLLGGVGIISPNLIKSVSKGVLNSHPGKLPEYRGSYVVRWALLNKDPIVITVHLVDASIDTGDILSEDLMIDIPKTRSLHNIESYIENQRAKLIIKTAQSFLKKDLIQKPLTVNGDSHLYSVLPLKKTLSLYWSLNGKNSQNGF